jgi:2,3-bisphosphoglycerate-independent phosphoglycerate mutase
MDPQKRVTLIILDGWGVAPEGPGNAIKLAKKPHFDSLVAGFPSTQLGASGESVGLPRGEVGNTETGHLNIGAGRIVYQDLVRINMSIADGSFFDNDNLLKLVSHITKTGGGLHLMGLVGAGGVHSAVEHLHALIHFCAKHEIKKVYIHVFTDGRDSPPSAANTYISQLEEVLTRERVGQIVSVMGRYWAMDRDLRWDRTAKAYFALTKSEGKVYESAHSAVSEAYQRGQTDEFIEPSLIKTKDGVVRISDGDAIVFFNFRIDRPRQLTRSFVLPDEKSADWDFDPHAVEYDKHHQTQKPNQIGFERGPLLKNIFFATMTEYERQLTQIGVMPLFPPQHISMPLGRVISEEGILQLRASESEKERFVSYYLNGLLESPLDGEERLIVPSPKVATYDLMPQMSALELTDKFISKLSTGEYGFSVVNFANADMVGHTGVLSKAIEAVETLDSCIGKIADFTLNSGGLLVITADHGNAEEMINPKTGGVSTEHSANPVPFIAVSNKFVGKPQQLSPGILADVAPTILSFMGIPASGSMMGRDLLSEYARRL